MTQLFDRLFDQVLAPNYGVIDLCLSDGVAEGLSPELVHQVLRWHLLETGPARAKVLGQVDHWLGGVLVLLGTRSASSNKRGQGTNG